MRNIVITVTEENEQLLRDRYGDGLPATMLEAIAIDGYRNGLFSIGQVAEILGLTTIQADDLLARRGVTLDFV